MCVCVCAGQTAGAASNVLGILKPRRGHIKLRPQNWSISRRSAKWQQIVAHTPHWPPSPLEDNDKRRASRRPLLFLWLINLKYIKYRYIHRHEVYIRVYVYGYVWVCMCLYTYIFIVHDALGVWALKINRRQRKMRKFILCLYGSVCVCVWVCLCVCVCIVVLFSHLWKNCPTKRY